MSDAPAPWTPIEMPNRKAWVRFDRPRPATPRTAGARNPRLPAPRRPGAEGPALRPTPGPQDLVAGPWGARFRGRRLPCAVGRGGIRADKREGDGATPAGSHRLVGLLWRPDRARRPTDWAVPIRPGDLWSDDARDPDHYNLLVRAPYAGSHERLRRADPLYDRVGLTDWNWPRAEAGRGSAIFLHRWRKPRHPTEGCVAFAPEVLRWLLPRIRHRTRLVVR